MNYVSNEQKVVATESESHIEMACADENFVQRVFTLVDDDGDIKDYVCEHCGFLQESAAAGAAELCRLATWHDRAEYQKYAIVARSGGYDVPEEPPTFLP